MNTDPSATIDGARQSARTLVEFAYHQIRERILNGSLDPGSKLKVEVLRAEYGVGASTMREALSLLIADALVTAEGQRGFRVAPISLEDLLDVTKTRKLLECQALRESIENGGDEWEAGVVAAYHRLTLIEDRLYEDPINVASEWEVRNRAFHDALTDGCKSKWLLHFHHILYNQAIRYRRMSLMTPKVSRDVRTEHKQILDAALKRDAALACRLTEEHIDRTLDTLAPILRDRAAVKLKFKAVPEKVIRKTRASGSSRGSSKRT